MYETAEDIAALQALLDRSYYGPRRAEGFLDSLADDGFYARIDAERMFTFRMDPEG